MKKMPLCSLMLSFFIMSCLVACGTSKMARAEIGPVPINAAKEVAPSFHSRVEVNISLREDQEALKSEAGALKADIYKPNNKIEPKTLVILVPGSGSVSRRGEVSDDGINNYKSPAELYALWGKALADQGFFVLSYDKRSCTKNINALCVDNPRKDLDEKGIGVLARDLDDVYRYATRRFDKENSRIIIMGHTQAAQVIALAKEAQSASGIVLLSPIAGNLEKMQYDGFMSAHAKQGAGSKKTLLLNRADKIKLFFASLAKGKFPDNATIHGASVNFWKSWMSASENTIKLLLARNQPTIVLTSKKDVFSPADTILKDINLSKIKHNFTVKNIDNVDRNFINNDSLAKEPILEVINFVKARAAIVAGNEPKPSP